MIAIAIDGPAGAGKSSIARKVAANLGYIYVFIKTRNKLSLF